VVPVAHPYATDIQELIRMARVFKWEITALFFALCLPVLADDGEDREALRIEIEHLRESGNVGRDPITFRRVRENARAPHWSVTEKQCGLKMSIKSTMRVSLPSNARAVIRCAR